MEYVNIMYHPKDLGEVGDFINFVAESSDVIGELHGPSESHLDIEADPAYLNERAREIWQLSEAFAVQRKVRVRTSVELATLRGRLVARWRAIMQGRA